MEIQRENINKSLIIVPDNNNYINNATSDLCTQLD